MKLVDGGEAGYWPLRILLTRGLLCASCASDPSREHGFLARRGRGSMEVQVLGLVGIKRAARAPVVTESSMSFLGRRTSI